MSVSGIEGNPVFVVATEDAVWSTTSDDYVSGVPLLDLLARVRPGERVYLVHLDSTDHRGRVKLTDLFVDRLAETSLHDDAAG